MPLTNPNKIVTEERLSEFYGQILPYMGGMPDVLANKFSKGDLYSTDEKMIGVWIDEKPLYMRSASKSYTASQMASGAPVNLINLGSDCHVLFASGSAHSTTNGSLPINYFDSGVRVNLAFNMNDAGSAIQEGNVWVASNWNKDATVYVNLYYTKTTDSPISIGSDTDYSTNEKIVGTDVDGKFVYQRSFEYASVNGDAIIGTISDFYKLKRAEGTFVNSSNDLGVFPFVYTNQYTDIYCASNGAVHVMSNVSLTNVFVTVQYTKTTD